MRHSKQSKEDIAHHLSSHEDGGHIHHVGRMNAVLGIGQLCVGAFGSKTLVAAGLHNLSDWASYSLKTRSLKKNTTEGLFDRYAATAVMVVGGAGIIGVETVVGHGDGPTEGPLQYAELGAMGAELGVAGASVWSILKTSGARAVTRDARRHVLLVDTPGAVVTAAGVVGGNYLHERFDTAGLVAHAGLLIGAAAMSLRDSDHDHH